MALSKVGYVFKFVVSKISLGHDRHHQSRIVHGFASLAIGIGLQVKDFVLPAMSKKGGAVTAVPPRK
jgi:hypothetical protein